MTQWHYCKRYIANGRRIVDNGVKYICKNDKDVLICNIRNPVENYETDLYEQRQKYLKQNGATHIRCSCGHSFYTDFPMETEPGCESCSKCGILHHDNDKLKKASSCDCS